MPMTKVKHEKKVRRRGKIYYYHQVTGERLPNDYESRIIRLLEINRTLQTDNGVPGAPAFGSFAATIKRYRGSADFTERAPKTRREYGRHLDAIDNVFGKLKVADLRRRHVKSMRDKMQSTPREANYRLSVLHILLAFAIDDELVRENVAAGVDRLKEGPGYQAWPTHVYEKAIEAADKELADYFRLLAWTGQRPQDVIAMTWAAVDRKSGFITLKALKTNEDVFVPLHPGLIADLEAIPKRAPQILTRASGRPWKSVNELGRRTREVMEAIEEHKNGYTPHGLRHSAGDALAEAGCSQKQIQAVLGHKSARMVERYTRTADKKRLASAAIQQLHGNK